MEWWNSLADEKRAHWMTAAGNTGIVADAWAAFKLDAELRQVGLDRDAVDGFMAHAMGIGRKRGG